MRVTEDSHLLGSAGCQGSFGSLPASSAQLLTLVAPPRRLSFLPLGTGWVAVVLAELVSCSCFLLACNVEHPQRHWESSQ